MNRCLFTLQPLQNTLRPCANLCQAVVITKLFECRVKPTVASEVFKHPLLGRAISSCSCLIRGTVFKMSFNLSKTL